MKNNSALKYFTIALFLVELLVPVFLSSGITLENDCHQSALHKKEAIVWLTAFLCEGPGGEEEKDGKEHQRIFFDFHGHSTNHYADLFTSILSTLFSKANIQHTNVHGSLFSLFQTFRI
jgi:hypothetical protein